MSGDLVGMSGDKLGELGSALALQCISTIYSSKFFVDCWVSWAQH